MATFQKSMIVSDDGTLVIADIPFPPGEIVQVTIQKVKEKQRRAERYPLRGKPIKYIDPFKSVAEDDWLAIK